MRWIFLLFLVVLTPYISCQIIFDKTTFDFGDLYQNDTRFVDFYLKNNTAKEVYILSVRKPMEIVYIQQSALINSDESSIIRFQINQNKKGKFFYEIPVYTSDKNEPTILTIKGRIMEPTAQDALTSCPDFNQSPADGNPLDFLLTVEVVDEETNEPISKANIALIQNGYGLGHWETNKKGLLKIKVPLGITYFYGQKENYLSDEKAEYVNFQNNHVLLKLKKEIQKIQEEPVVEQIESELEDEEHYIDILSTSKEEKDSKSIIDLFKKEKDSTVEEPIEEAHKITLEELDEDNFSEEYFKPINVVFIVDVSSSMKQLSRLDLLKYSFNQLIDMIRPQDKISLIAYSDDARVLIHPTSGDQKELLKEEVENLKAYGATAGEAGIKMGYKQAKKAKLKEGRNHVIIITDGAFNKGSGDYKNIIEKNLKNECITLSVVGIKSNEKAEENMTEAALLGKGRFILIDKLEDAQTKLNQEIRQAAFRKF